MDKQLRDLAFAIVKEQTVNSKHIESLVDSLSVKELRTFLRYLRLAQDAQTITVTTASDTPELKKYIAKNFADKHIVYTTDETIGGGVIVKIGDDVYDYTVRNYIDTTIKRLINEL